MNSAPPAPKPDDIYALTLNERIDLAVARTMKRERISAAEIARRVGVHANTLSAWRNGNDRPRDQYLDALAELTEHPRGWIEHGNRSGQANVEQWMVSTTDGVRRRLIEKGFTAAQARDIANGIPTTAFAIAHANAVHELAECYGTNGRGTRIDPFADINRD